MTFPSLFEVDHALCMRKWIIAHRPVVTAALEASGAVLLRGSRCSEDELRDIVWDLSTQPVDYVYRSTPRTELGGGLFTATEYPAGLEIPMHNENAYQREWPLRLFFYCERPADGGGQTPLADTVAVTRRIGAAVKERFRSKQVMYIRNYLPDVDVPWQVVFQTDSRTGVEAFCRGHGIACEWLGPDRLRTRQVCQALATHPKTGVEVWFNQAHLFHPSSLDAQTQEILREMYPEDEWPRNATHGDGSPISTTDLQSIRDAFAREATQFDWHAGDLLVLDNMRVSHGRRPYRGMRKIIVAMCDLYAPNACDVRANSAQT